jgi:hypothetical protein
MASKECQICASTFSNKVRKPIECIFCNKSCCKECFSAFTKEQSVPKCMFCNAELNMDFVADNTTGTFMTAYNKYLDDLKFNLEKSKLPVTQYLAELTRKHEEYVNIYSEKMRENTRLNNRRKILTIDLKHNRDNLIAKTELRKHINSIQKLMEENIEYSDNIFNMRVITRREIQQHIDILTGVAQPAEDDVKITYSRPCISDDCRGFLSKAYKCGTCEKHFCAECHEEKTNKEHVCNDESKATIAMIKRDSKPCPKCSIPIEKVSGCSQMWCVNCHTTFDWNTMNIETGYIHNPEYLRWMRENNKEISRNPFDNPNGGCDMPSWTEINRRLSRVGVVSTKWDEIHIKYGHIRYHVMRNLPKDNEIEFIDLRVQYLNSQISYEEWNKKLKMKLKINRLGQDRYNVYDMYTHALKDLFLNMFVDYDYKKFKDSYDELEKYTNTQLEKINKKHKSKNSQYLKV